MTSQTLSTVTLQTLENYRDAASRAVAAYHLGGKRLLGLVNGALENGVYPRTAKVAPRATERLNEVRGNVSEIIVKGADQVAQRTEQAIAFSSDTAAAQVSKMADFAAGIDNSLIANGLQAAARLTMPAAQVALAVSSKVAKGAHALADAAGARPVRGIARKALKTTHVAAAGAKRRAAPVARKAQATMKTTAKRVAKVGKRVAA
jgi:hypothetical protein